MTLNEFSRIAGFAISLPQVTPSLSRLAEKKVPAILSEERNKEEHRQMILPQCDPDDPSRDYFQSLDSYYDSGLDP